ncbi:MAG: hypothetical protein COT16_00280, partial [Elusimicrobia bacterium CG08_land_8_20_14_0_20_44_26]
DLENEKKTKKEKNEEAFKLKERLIGVQEQLKIKENEIKILQNTVSSSTEELKFEHYQKREESEMMGNQFKQEIGKLQKKLDDSTKALKNKEAEWTMLLNSKDEEISRLKNSLPEQDKDMLIGFEDKVIQDLKKAREKDKSAAEKGKYKCSNCKKIVYENYDFCPHCGEKFLKE